MTRLPAPNATRCLLVSAALLAFLVAIVSPGVVQAATSGKVIVRAPGLSTVQAPISLTDGSLSPAGQAECDDGTQVDKFSLESILDAAQSDKPDALQWDDAPYVDVDKPGFGKIRLSIEDVTSGDAVYFHCDTTTYFEFGSKSLKFTGADPGVTIGEVANLVEVEVSASSTKVKAGDQVNFRGKVSGVPSGESVSYRWSINGVTEQETDSLKFRHTFEDQGNFSVVLTATIDSTGDEGFGGASIQVGKAKESKKDREGGGNEDDGDETGSYTPPADYGYESYGYGAPGGTGGSGTGSPGAGSSSPGSTPAPPVEQPPAEPVDDGLETISGELVSSTAPAATIDPSLPGASEALQDGSPASDSFGLPREAWVVLGILALFGFGMLAERRGSRLS